MSTAPRAEPPAQYEELGGAPVLRAVVDRFYGLMDEIPEYYAVRKLHPQDLAGSREKLFMFLSGWLGGPPLYVEAHGHPRLRARHLPFPIASAERDGWLACMRQALDECGVEPAMRDGLMQALFQTADWMRNREG